MMVAPQDHEKRQSAGRTPNATPTRLVGGITLMFLGVALMSYGAHFLAKTGTCSGTGYVSYGPVPRCGSDEALYIMSAFFVGPLAAILGWLIARAWGWLWPSVCIGVGAGLVTIRNETTTTGAGTLGLVGGICLFALAGLSVIVSVRKRRRPTGPRETSGPGATAMASTPAPARLGRQGTRAASPDRSDPLATLARLAQLRDAGALTDEEFAIQKARLLAEL